MQEEKIVSFKCYTSTIAAEVDMEVLKENGIECVLNEGAMVGLFPIFDDKERGLEVLVFAKDLERARLLVDEYHRAGMGK